MEIENSHIRTLKREFAEKKIDSREILRVATLLGLSASAAYSSVGILSG